MTKMQLLKKPTSSSSTESTFARRGCSLTSTSSYESAASPAQLAVRVTQAARMLKVKSFTESIWHDCRVKESQLVTSRAHSKTMETARLGEVAWYVGFA